jgi:Cu(I)/Ag(I) efflux system membrane fusion protein
MSPDQSEMPRLPKRLASWALQLAALAVTASAFFFGLWLGVPADKPPAANETAAKAELWTCSMHPQIQLPDPGKCPICGMDLIPLDTSHGSGPPTEVKLSDRARLLSKLQTVVVSRGNTAVELKLLGRLEIDETRLRTVTPWVGGRIDRLYVRATGETIGRGQSVASVYSPEVYAAHQDLISSKRQLERLKSALPIARTASVATLESARERLRLLGVPEKELSAMEREKAPRRQVRIRSPYGGTIVERLIDEGQFITPGTPMFKLAGLSELWVQLDAYEGDLPKIFKGQTVTLSVASRPGESFEGKVSFIDPVLNPTTRTARVRVEVDNRKKKLTPGTFAEAVIHVDEKTKSQAPLVIPETAPLFTGKRSVVYVEKRSDSELSYEPREVQLGPRAGNLYPVVSGLTDGERVVVQGAFSLDSELQIRGGRSMMTLDGDPEGGAQSALSVPTAFKEGLKPIVNAYLALQRALASDDLAKATKAMADLKQRADAFHPASPKAASNAWHGLRADLVRVSASGAAAKDIAGLRARFLEASQLMVDVLHRFGNPTAEAVRLAHCPMAAGGKGAHWLQSAEVVENPYFGAKMHSCGDVVEAVSSGAQLSKKSALPASSKAGTPAPGGHAH